LTFNTEHAELVSASPELVSGSQCFRVSLARHPELAIAKGYRHPELTGAKGARHAELVSGSPLTSP